MESPKYKVSRDVAAVLMPWYFAGFHNNATLLNVIFWN
jgi:hypothetical protein